MMASAPALKTHTIQSFKTSGGGRVFQLPLEAFPDFWAHAYLVLVDEYRVLIDVGSNYHHSNENLEDGLRQVAELTGERVGLDDLTHILITHGHIDHFGGLAYVGPRSSAKVGVHELDRRILTNYEERLAIVAHRLNGYLLECGVSPPRVKELHDMYMLPKSLFSSVKVDFTYEAAGMCLGPFEMLHVPGHCPGQVVIRLHDVLFSADHVLSAISPHQAPESLSLHTGLDHYLRSLKRVAEWAPDVRLVLGGHNDPFDDLPGRVAEIVSLHKERLSQVFELLAEPCTIADISKALFGKTSGYNVLLGLEEAGAHIEFLYQRGLLGIDNLKELESSEQPVPIFYRRQEERLPVDSLMPWKE